MLISEASLGNYVLAADAQESEVEEVFMMQDIPKDFTQSSGSTEVIVENEEDSELGDSNLRLFDNF